jgi:hypothetical protein
MPRNQVRYEIAPRLLSAKEIRRPIDRRGCCPANFYREDVSFFGEIAVDFIDASQVIDNHSRFPGFSGPLPRGPLLWRE